MHLDSFKIALIGRTNVGKSTLFNRLIRSNQALTFNQPGVTRDTKEKEIFIFNKRAVLIDCPGMFDYAECDNRPELMNAINAKLNSIIRQADITVFVIDAIEGITFNDRKIADILRKAGKKVILAINKTEGNAKHQGLADAASLGFSKNILISSEHGLGIDELLENIYDTIPDDFIDEQENEISKCVKLAFIGRPNVGKSTLINALLGSDKQLVADFPGLTRESAMFDFDYNGTKFKIIDTPGVRRKAKIHDRLEKISVTDSLRSYRHADAVVLVIDATSLKEGFIEKQDLTLASHVLKDGKALVIAFNKYDATPYKKNSQPAFLRRNFERSLAQHRDVPFLFISALKNENLNRLIETVQKTQEQHKVRINTSKLNRWLQIIGQSEAMSHAAGKLKYITQIGETPPTFLIFVSKELRRDQERFVLNHFKRHFNLQETPVKLIFKRGKCTRGE